MSATPDTGCTWTIINTQVLERNEITYNKGGRVKLIPANGEKMKVDGYIEIQAKGNDVTVTMDALVSKARQYRMTC